MKSDRLDVIRSIITNTVVQSQQELQELLSQNGYEVTQATLSRDLRTLGVLKVHDSSLGYCYRMPNSFQNQAFHSKGNRFTIETIKSVEFSDSNCVIKTYPGFAGAVASVIDGNVKSGIMGTLAGDDTVLLILRKPVDQKGLLTEIAHYISEIDTKLI